MTFFQQDRLESGDIAFRLQTNALVDARRFADFLHQLANGRSAEKLPGFDFRIVTLSTGSLNGILRLILQDEEALRADDLNSLREIAEEAKRRNDIAETILEEMRASTAASERTASAVEILASEMSLDRADRVEKERVAERDRKEAKWVGRAAIALSLAALIHDFAADAKSDAGTASSKICAGMMHEDGLAQIDFWTKHEHIVIGHSDVPLYRAMQEGRQAVLDGLEEGDDIVRATGSVGRAPGNESADIPFPGSAHFPSGSDDPPQELYPQPSSPIAAPLPGDLVTLDGTVSYRGGYEIFETDDTPTDRTMILLTIPGVEVSDGSRYRITGTIRATPGDLNVLVANSVELLTVEDRPYGEDGFGDARFGTAARPSDANDRSEFQSVGRRPRAINLDFEETAGERGLPAPLARPRGIDAARPAAENAPIGTRVDLEGRAFLAGDAYSFKTSDGAAQDMILLPPEGSALIDGHRYRVTGRLYSPSPDFDILSAQLIEPLD